MQPISLSVDAKAHIDAQLSRQGLKPTAAFYDAIGKAICFYRAHKQTARESSPAKVRANLKKAHKAALKLQETIFHLDGNSCQLLHESGILPQKIRRHVEEITFGFNQALNLANDFPVKGNLPDNARVFLARNVADAMQQHLDAKPTTTKEGCFASILSIVLEAATGDAAEAVHVLMAQAFSMVKKSSPGLTEYQR